MTESVFKLSVEITLPKLKGSAKLLNKYSRSKGELNLWQFSISHIYAAFRNGFPPVYGKDKIHV